MTKLFGYYGKILEVDLTKEKISVLPLSEEDAYKFIGGRGLEVKILWDKIKKPGLDPLSPQNSLIFMPGPFSGFPIPSVSRVCIITKSPLTSPIKSKYKFASTLTYSNMGGFFGPEIKFAGYDGTVITRKSSLTSIFVYK